MEEIKLYEIINGLEELNPRKAKKLRKLANDYSIEQDPKRKKKIQKTIRDFVYNVYLKCLSKKSREEIYNTGIVISEQCYTVEKEANNGWYIFFDGAKRLQKTEDGVTVIDIIPREYKKGFQLEDNPTANAKHFYSKYYANLQGISRDMDRKQELTSYDYETKSPFIPIEFIENIIDFLELSRIPKEEKQK